MPDTPFAENPELSAISITFQNPDYVFIGDQVMPRVPTAHSFTWTKYAVESGYTVPRTEVGRTSAPNVVTFSGSSETSKCKDYGLDTPVPQADIDIWSAMPKPASGGPIEPRQLATMFLTGLIQIDREIRVAEAVADSANYAAGNSASLTAAQQWSNYDTGNPIQDIKKAISKCLVKPNTLTLSIDVWNALNSHPVVVQTVRGTAQQYGLVAADELAKVLGLKSILIGESRVNTKRPGKAAAIEPVWGNFAQLAFISSLGAQTQQPTWGWTAQFGSKFAGSFYDPKGGGLAGAHTVRVGERVREVVAANQAGYLFTNVIAAA